VRFEAYFSVIIGVVLKLSPFAKAVADVPSFTRYVAGQPWLLASPGKALATMIWDEPTEPKQPGPIKKGHSGLCPFSR
jgi:hypothetical protein